MRFPHLKTGWLWVLGGGLSLTFSGSAIAQEAGTPAKPQVKDDEPAKEPLFPFTISKETTRITEPLNADGTVNFAAALNARNSAGLEPSDNAGTLLMQAFGPASVPEANRERFYKALGIAIPASENGAVKDLGQLIKKQLEAKGQPSDDNAAFEPFWEQQGQAMRRPWSRREFPLMAQWVEANRDALKLLADASQKSRLYLPLVVGEKETLVAANMEGIQEMRNAARLLTASAMLALEEGRIEEAQADLLACHRLASLLGQHASMIQALVSYAIDAVACQADLALAQSDKVSREQLAAYRQQLAEVPGLPKIGQVIDENERFIGLDVICHLATNLDEETAQAIGLPKSFRRLMSLSIDWDLILKRFNAEYDQMAASMNLPSYAERQMAIDEMEAKLKKLRADASHPAKIAMMAFAPRSAVSQQMSDILLLLLVPAVAQTSQAETRFIARRDQTLTALALAEYHREHGHYPESLAALAPKYLKVLPQDPFSGEPFKYQRQDAGYLLYNVGANGKDDKGQDRNANPDADDWGIRVPMPPAL